MVEIESITEKDEKNFQSIFSSASRSLGWEVGDSVKVKQNDRESILFYCNQVFMQFSYDQKGNILRNTIQMDDEGKVLAFTITQGEIDYQVMVDDDMLYLIDENGFHQSLQLYKDSSAPSAYEVECNGLLDYTQYDGRKDIRVVTRYEQPIYSSVSEKMLFTYSIRQPYSICYEECASKRQRGFFFLGRKNSYYRMDFDIRNNKWQYDLATLGEYGVGAVLANDTVSLQNGNTAFSRFYRVLFHVGDYITITGFPFLRSYSEQDIEDQLCQMEFHSSVPTFIIDLFNQRFQLLADYQELIDSYLQFQYGKRGLTKEKR